MDRSIIYSGQNPRSADLLVFERAAMIGLAWLTQSVLGGTSTMASGLTATAGSGTTINIAAGAFYSLANVDDTSYGSLSLNTTNQVLKQGLQLGTVNLTGFAAPGSAGQSINYLIEAKFQEVDTTPVVLMYYNSANPAVYLQGSGGSGSTQFTVRSGQITLQVKAGTAATTGSQTTPSADSGYTPLWVVEMRTGDTTPNAGRITAHSSAPFLAGLLNQHHKGTPGHAPKIQLNSAAEVQGQLPMANLFASDVLGTIPAMQAFAGNPNGNVAGNAAVAGTSAASFCMDTTESVLWICTSTGTTSTAVWTPILLGYSGIWAGTSGGSANVQTLTPTPAISSYTTGLRISFQAGFTNTASLTINVSGKGAKNVYKDGPAGPTALAGGEIVANEIYTITYDGTQFQLTATEMGTSSLKNTGVTVVDPGTGALEISEPASTQTGTGYTFTTTDRGLFKQRSNSGTAMSDLLPATAPANGWMVTIQNIDATANYTVAAQGALKLNNVTTGSVSLSPLQTVTIVSDGTGYWTQAAPFVAVGTWGGTSAGAANVQTLTPTPSITAYTTGMRISFIAGFSNTSALTLNISGLGAKNVYKDGPSGPIALAGGEVVVNEIYTVTYDGTQFQLTATEMGTSSLKNTGVTVVDPGTGALEIAEPASTQTGANYTFVTADRGLVKQRSNSGVAMSDLLPAAAPTNGWLVTIQNIDATASYSVAAQGSLKLNNVTTGSIVLSPLQTVTIISDGANFWTLAAPFSNINIWGGTSGGAANVQTISPTPAITAYTTGLRISFQSGFSNSGALTLNVSGLGAKSVLKDGPSGPTALAGGEIITNEIYTVTYDGTQFQLTATEMGTASLKNTGQTIADPGTGALEIAEPSSVQTGTNYTFVSTDRGLLKQRSNSGAAMSDLLQATAPINGWLVTIQNIDATALYTIAAQGSIKLNNVTAGNFVLAPLQTVTISSDGTNFWAQAVVDTASAIAYQIGWLQ